MPTAPLGDLLNEVADTLRAVVGPAVGGETEVQVVGRRVFAPTPPSIDVYPGDPFRDNTTAGFQDTGGELILTVRARVNATDYTAGQDFLLRLMDDFDDISVATSLMDDQTLNGLATTVFVEGNSGMVQYIDPDPEARSGYLGCEWRVRILRAQS